MERGGGTRYVPARKGGSGLSYGIRRPPSQSMLAEAELDA